METLNLEHIAPSLPYKLALLTNYKDDIEIMTTSNIGVVCNHVDKDRLKPIYHPLSDLTKPIQRNGEELEFAITFEVYQNYTLEEYINENQGVNPIDLPYQIFEQMLKHRFNVFNLPAHLWIDVNTLSENPYK